MLSLPELHLAWANLGKCHLPSPTNVLQVVAAWGTKWAAKTSSKLSGKLIATAWGNCVKVQKQNNQRSLESNQMALFKES
jgi:hypothetical protein